MANDISIEDLALSVASADELFTKQLKCWAEACERYQALSGVRNRRIAFDGFDVVVQFNPARIVSASAKTDAATLAARPCFLCKKNRPECQMFVPFADFQLLVNPFPIFSPHYTIAHREHTQQCISPYVGQLIAMAERLQGLALFYNGPQCGASAPDHQHFQACRIDKLPVIADYFRFHNNRTTLVEQSKYAEVRTIENYLRTVVCIEATTADALSATILSTLQRLFPDMDKVEPKINLVTTVIKLRYYCWIFPRAASRPWQYSAPEQQRLLVSPGTVEMAGIVITPIEEHFLRITKDDIADIYSQCSMIL